MAVPSCFACPITHDLMERPVVAPDGHSFEESAIRQWFESGNRTSPMTNAQLPNTTLVPNIALRQAIEEWHNAQPLAIDPDRLRLSEEVIGEGSFGQVLAARLMTHDREQRVAVKMLPSMTRAEQRKRVCVCVHMCVARRVCVCVRACVYTNRWPMCIYTHPWKNARTHVREHILAHTRAYPRIRK